MKILFLNPVGFVGGAEQSLLTMIKALQALPGVCTALLTSGPGPLLAAAEDMGAEVACLPLPASLTRLGDSGLRRKSGLAGVAKLATSGAVAGGCLVRYTRQYRQAVNRFAPSLIHSNGIKTHLLARLARLHACPVVWHLHDFYGARPLISRATCWAARGICGAIAVSQAVADEATNVLPKVPTRTIHNCVDLQQFSPEPARGEWLDRLAGFEPSSQPVLRVGLVATFARWKGQDLFLQAAAAYLAKQRPAAVRFYIIGSAIYHTAGSQFSADEIRSLAQRLGISAHVGLVPFQQDTPSVYRSLDVVVHASTQPEPFGLTIAEAMACGRATIVSQAGGAAELFTHGQDAVGFTMGDPSSLEAALEKVLQNSETREQLGNNARATACQKFSSVGLGQRLMDFYQASLGDSCWPAPTDGLHTTGTWQNLAAERDPGVTAKTLNSAARA